MTVSSTPRKAGPFLGNGATTAFPFTFKVFAEEDLAVYFTDTEGVQVKLTGGYTVTLNADQEASPGGVVTYPSAGFPLEEGEQLDLISDAEYTQPTDISNASRFLPGVIQRAMDRIVILVQQLLEQLNRTLRFPPGDTASGELPSAADRANKALSFDASGNPEATVDFAAVFAAAATAQAAAIAAQQAASVAAGGEGNWSERQTGTDGVLWTLNFLAPITKVRNIFINGRRQRLSNFTITLATGQVLANFEIPADSQVDINWV